MPPDLLDHMLIEAMDGQGGMPGGLDAVVADEEAALPDNVVGVNFNPDPLRDQQIPAVQPRRREEEDVDNDSNSDEEDDEEEEDISVRSARSWSNHIC